jgi:hypothetical protein
MQDYKTVFLCETGTVPARRFSHGPLPEIETGQMATMKLTSGAEQQTKAAVCRFCGAALRRTFVDLGMSPLGES